jgi:LPXTG-motif cell wall-anchored protein
MREDDTPPPPELGEIVISKTLIDEDEQGITDDDTEFEFTIERYVEGDWVEIDESPVFLAGGESETLEDLPLGLYRVTEDEDLPDGYTRVSSAFVEVTLSDDGDSEDADFTNMREDDTPPPPELGEIEVTKRVLNRSGNVFSSTTEFFFELQVAGEGGWVTIDDGSIIGNGSLTFEDLDDGEYRVREVSINSAYFLVTNNNLEVDIVEASSEDVEFTNRLRPIDDDDNDDDDDDNDIDDDDDDDDTDTPEVESETVTPDPIPQAPPVVETVQPEPEVEEEIMEEPVPQATLPKTGASDPSVFAGFGAALMAFGAFLKRKKDD